MPKKTEEKNTKGTKKTTKASASKKTNTAKKNTTTKKVVKEEVEADAPSVIIAQRPCALLKTVKYEGHCTVTDKCKNCKMCMKLGCPAITATENGVKIDPNQCNGCGLCMNVCPFGAIEKRDYGGGEND